MHGVIRQPQPLCEDEEEEEERDGWRRTPRLRRSGRKGRTHEVLEEDSPTMTEMASEEEEGAMSKTSSTSNPTRRRSGSQVQHGASSHRSMPRSNDQMAEAAGEAAGVAADAAKKALRAAEVASWAARSAERASQLMEQVSHMPSEAAASSAASSRVAPKAESQDQHPSNPWNRFQHENAGKNWGSEKMRAEYFKAKTQCHRKMP